MKKKFFLLVTLLIGVAIAGDALISVKSNHLLLVIAASLLVAIGSGLLVTVLRHKVHPSPNLTRRAKTNVPAALGALLGVAAAAAIGGSSLEPIVVSLMIGGLFMIIYWSPSL